jgi:adenosine kinase
MKKDKVFIVGSLAFDHVMQYEGFFSNVMIPGDANLTVTAHSRFINFGGCGGNISYTLSLLGEKPVLMTLAGYDLGEYENHLKKFAVNIDYVYKSAKYPTASAFIITDKQHNQITIFEPGAMHAEEDHFSLADTNFDSFALAVIAPDHPARMLKIALECKKYGVPYLFDPGQQINVFENENLLLAARNASYFILNQYEAKLVKSKLNIDDVALRNISPVYIETHGERGGLLYMNNNKFEYHAVKPVKIDDPTGCGDAFRAGLLAALRRGDSVLKSCNVGALAATFSIESAATQTHTFSKLEFAKRYMESFGEALDWC